VVHNFGERSSCSHYVAMPSGNGSRFDPFSKGAAMLALEQGWLARAFLSSRPAGPPALNRGTHFWTI
jgi:hypothetical protein